MSTHPIIDRLASMDSEELSVAAVAGVLGRSVPFIYSIIATGELPSLKEAARAGKKDRVTRGRRHQYTITRMDVLTYLLSKAEGDKTALLYAIKQSLPASHFRAALALTHKPAKPAEPAAQEAPAPAPSNVIPFRKPRKKGPLLDPYAGHPELFPLPTPPAQTA